MTLNRRGSPEVPGGSPDDLPPFLIALPLAGEPALLRRLRAHQMDSKVAEERQEDEKCEGLPGISCLRRPAQAPPHPRFIVLQRVSILLRVYHMYAYTYTHPYTHIVYWDMYVRIYHISCLRWHLLLAQEYRN